MATKPPFWEVVKILAVVFTYSFGAIMSILWKIIRNGPKKVFGTMKRDIRPDHLDDPSFGTHGFARLKQIKLHYVAKGPESKPLMLFLHGFPEFWYSWRHQLQEFGGDYRAVAVDLRGYGESDKPQGTRSYAMDMLLNDVKELIPALGHEKCILVGHDWGGAIAWSFARLHPEMVERVIVCNCPTGGAFRRSFSTNREQLKKSWYMFFFQIPKLPELSLRVNDYDTIANIFRISKEGAFTDDDIEMYKYTFSQPGALTSAINYYRATFQCKPKIEFPSKKVQVPSLMIWGTDDKALGKEMAEMSRDDVEDYRLHYIEGASHWVQNDEPERVNKLIRNFLSENKEK